jgi:hypothetical protein
VGNLAGSVNYFFEQMKTMTGLDLAKLIEEQRCGQKMIHYEDKTLKNIGSIIWQLDASEHTFCQKSALETVNRHAILTYL